MIEKTKLFCIQLADNLFRRKHRDIEHRKFIRLDDSISIGMRLIDTESGNIYSRQIKGRTLNISREGLCIESSTVTVNGVDIFNDAMSIDKSLEIEIYAFKGEENIKAFGDVIWLDMTPKEKSFIFKAGVFLTFKSPVDTDMWHKFVESTKKNMKGKSRFVKIIRNFFRNKSASLFILILLFQKI